MDVSTRPLSFRTPCEAPADGLALVADGAAAVADARCPVAQPHGLRPALKARLNADGGAVPVNRGRWLRHGGVLGDEVPGSGACDLFLVHVLDELAPLLRPGASQVV